MDETLEHHGIKGMKWGVRRTPEQLGHPMSKRQAKKAIISAKRAERKRSGTRMSTGKNMTRVAKNHRKALENDPRLKELNQQRDSAEKKIYKYEATIGKAKATKDHLTRLQQDPSASTEMRKQVEQRYLKEKEAARKAGISLEKAEAAYEKADLDHYARTREIGAEYAQKYKEAAVKDIGIEDTKAGVKMLEDYGLVNKATRINIRL